jgi:hypothetical protein
MFKRNCPKCNDELFYKNKNSYRTALYNNPLCKHCSRGYIKPKKGDRYNRLVLIELIGNKGSRWLCGCDCGNLHESQLSHLKIGYVKSCGCLNRELNIQRSTKHNYRKRGEPHYLSSLQTRIKSVCNNPNNHKYPDYGGRGIDYDPRFNDCKIFVELILKYLGERPTQKHSMNRIDNDKGYWLNNMEWADNKRQANNRRKQKKPNTHIDHRKLYKEHYQININGYDIHHINGNHFDNTITNLIHVTRKQHGWLESPTQNNIKEYSREQIIEILKKNNT